MIAMLPPHVHFTDQVWVSDVARWPSADQYRASCLLDDQLPVVEPDGRYNVLAMQAAARALPQMTGNDAARRDAACRLVRLLRMAQITAPRHLIELAAGMTQQRSVLPAHLATLRQRMATLTRRDMKGHPVEPSPAQRP